MKFNRKFGMPHHKTFRIKPINELLDRYVHHGKWLDPFANETRLNDKIITNDLNPAYKTDFNLDFRKFLSKYHNEIIKGILLDPPYSPRQIKEHYVNAGFKLTYDDSHGLYQHAWELIIQIKPEYVIQFGWHSNGRKEYYKVIEILLVTHGGNHYDTIVSVHKRLNQSLEDTY